MFVQIIRIYLKNSNTGAIHNTTKNTLNIPRLSIFFTAQCHIYLKCKGLGLLWNWPHGNERERKAETSRRERSRERERERAMHRLLTHKHVQRSKRHMILQNTQTSSIGIVSTLSHSQLITYWHLVRTCFDHFLMHPVVFRRAGGAKGTLCHGWLL